VCSRVSSLPEVVGESALLFDPEDTTSIADVIGQALGDDDLREDLKRRGLSRAAEFSWERTARETLELYRTVVG
jgi:glycosyltransferase involved in cell wall biosynthesis